MRMRLSRALIIDGNPSNYEKLKRKRAIHLEATNMKQVRITQKAADYRIMSRLDYTCLIAYNICYQALYNFPS